MGSVCLATFVLPLLRMRLKKSYGQHVLISQGVIAKIVQFAQLEYGEVVVEIGPGTGNLTKEILKYPIAQLHLVELDREMVDYLKSNIKSDKVYIHHEDAVKFDFCRIGKNLKVLGNLPYNVGSLILENVVFHKDCIYIAVFMLQKEVAEKIEKGSSWLSTFVRTFYRVEYLMSVPARFFIPPPKVQSGVVKLSRLDGHNFDLEDYKKFLTNLYAQRRKAIKNKLDEDLLQKARINPMARVEDLRLEDVINLYVLSKER